MDNKKKRERSVNFTLEETEYLLSLIELRKHIIENKKSDAVTWQDKEKAWKAIEAEYNSAGIGPFRDARHLKVKFEAIKRDTRKKAIYNNGNGNHVPLTPIEQRVKELILMSDDGNESTHDSTYDSDPIDISASDVLRIDIQEPYSDTDKNSEISYEYPEEEEPKQKKICVKQEIDSVPNTSQVQQPEIVPEWKPTSPKNSPKKPPVLSTPKPTKRLDKLVENKMEIIELQKKLIQEEIEEKKLKQQLLLDEIGHKHELHQLEKQHLLLKIELLKKELQNEH